MPKSILERRISVASGREPADCVIRNGKIIDVFNGEIMEGDIAIVDGYIAGIGHYEGRNIFDANNRYISPGFIDGHVHIESSMVTPSEFAKVLLPCGVTSIICDPHEIANVSGVKGIQYMIDSSINLPFDIYFMLPSCVPATDFEHSGATLLINDLKPFFKHPSVLGLAEVMNFPAVFNNETNMIDKLIETAKEGKLIDGHAAGLSSTNLNVYMSAGIRTDHESTTAKEAKERLQKGMYLMIREGTVAKDVKNIIEVVTERNSRRCLFVTDDKHLDDLIHEGSIDHCVRLAIASGLSPLTAITMATLNAAECFQLRDKGAIAPGYKADLLILEDLASVKATHVFKNGRLVVNNGELFGFQENPAVNHSKLRKSVQFQNITESDLSIPLESKIANIIEIIPNSLITKHIKEEVPTSNDGFFQPSIQENLLKLAVIERHHLTGNIGLGIIKGLGLKSGAIGTTVAHDSHNLIIAGTTDQDMIVAAHGIREMQGGLMIVNNGTVVMSLELPIAGLISDQPYQEVYKKLILLNEALHNLGAPRHFNPFLTLSFLALPVIPELKLTDQGLFKVSTFRPIQI